MPVSPFRGSSDLRSCAARNAAVTFRSISSAAAGSDLISATLLVSSSFSSVSQDAIRSSRSSSSSPPSGSMTRFGISPEASTGRVEAPLTALPPLPPLRLTTRRAINAPKTMTNVNAPAAMSIFVCPPLAAVAAAAGTAGEGTFAFSGGGSTGDGGGAAAAETPSISTRILVELPIVRTSPLRSIRGAPLMRSPLRNVPLVESSSTTSSSSSSRKIVVFLRESPLSPSTRPAGGVRPMVSSSSSVTSRTPSGASMCSVAVLINDDGHHRILLSALRCPANARNRRSET